MCQAHVLRFACSHGLLMSIEPCKLGPCPFLKTTGNKLPQQPFKCYCCQHKRSSSFPSPKKDASCTSTIDSLNSVSSSSSISPPTSPIRRVVTSPLPNVALQPSGTLRYCGGPKHRREPSHKQFSFSCASASHYLTPHYAELPGFLPHQGHACPPCQVEEYRMKGDRDAISSARREFPHLRGEMLVRNGRIRENWETNLNLDKYVAEKRTEEKELWLHVLRKWTQDLKKGRVLLAEEEGLGLMA